jgi:diphthamide synthase (EF-2-diphthine--ammonia ligase)
MKNPRLKVLLSWSSGKDGGWALHVLRQQLDLEVVGLLTTFNEAFDRVAMHAVRRELVDAQAVATGLPLVSRHAAISLLKRGLRGPDETAIAEAKASG